MTTEHRTPQRTNGNDPGSQAQRHAQQQPDQPKQPDREKKAPQRDHEEEE